ncbi:MAG: hypothetical protein E7160_02025 [Firmicutes bacterium]|nr:hypothetical protein [Bacillota bacterium]
MIENITYDEILKIANEISSSAEKLSEVLQKNNITELNDFISTVEGYSKYLNTTVELYKEADIALTDLTKEKK